MIFVRVARIEGDRVYGIIVSTPIGPGFRRAQPYDFEEGAIIDWTVIDPQGAEEGNVVGNFLDRYHGECPQ